MVYVKAKAIIITVKKIPNIFYDHNKRHFVYIYILRIHSLYIQNILIHLRGTQMNLKIKILICSALLVAIPIIISSAIIGFNAASDSFLALQKSSEAQLISVRNITKGRIVDYLHNIDKQVKSFSKDRMIIDAMGEFSDAYKNYSTQSKLDPKTARKDLFKYYSQHFNNVYKQRNHQDSANIESWLNALSDTGVLLQYQLIQNNPNPLGEKHLLDSLEDGTQYDVAHQLYHPAIRYFLEEFEYYDVFLVDAKTGNVVYSVFKELDFATSLKSGSFSNTGIAKVFNDSRTQTDQDYTSINDFSSYPPSYQDPAAFISSPIVDDGKVIGTLIFQMPVGKINQIMTHNQQWKAAGLGESGETYLVGADQTLRSQSRFLIEDKSSYLAAITESGVSTKVLDAINAKDTAISLQPVNSNTAKLALSGQSGMQIVDDYRNVPVMSAYSSINYTGLNWAILAEIDAAEAQAPAFAISDTIKWYALLTGVSLILLGSIVGGIFAKSVSQPIIDLSRSIADIEKSSDLSFRLSSIGKDEIGSASSALNSMIEKFHKGISKVAGNAGKISNSVDSISQIAAHNNQLLSQQKQQTHGVLESMQNMTSSVDSVSSRLQDNLTAINLADQKSSEGHRTMQETIIFVDQLAKQIDTASIVIKDFEEHSSEIISVLDVIKAIADQTNLLALNAAIEAARAGEQGRGFAVVADEVRALAGRTQSSTSEINQVIEKLKASSNQAIVAMQQSQTLAEKLVSQATTAEEAFSEVSSSVAAIAQMNKYISSDVEQQQLTSAEIDQSINSISEITNENVSGSDRTATASLELAALAADLRSLVNEFKI